MEFKLACSWNNNDLRTLNENIMLFSDKKFQVSRVYQSGVDLISSLQSLADYTRAMLKQGQLETAKKCFEMIDKSYLSGDQTIKDLIIGNYLYALTITISYCHCEDILPVNLRTELARLDNALIYDRSENIDEQ
jgi:hypothetical protein